MTEKYYELEELVNALKSTLDCTGDDNYNDQILDIIKQAQTEMDELLPTVIKQEVEELNALHEEYNKQRL